MEEVVSKKIILLIPSKKTAVFECPPLKFLSSSCEAQAKKKLRGELASRRSSHIEEMRGEESKVE